MGSCQEQPAWGMGWRGGGVVSTPSHLREGVGWAYGLRNWAGWGLALCTASVYNGAILFNHTRINRMNTPEHLLKFEWYEKHQEWLINGGAGSRANLRGTDLRGANLRDADLRGANLRDADLRDADLWDASLRDADLRGTDLRGANLREANLWGADLRGANLWDADFRDADFRGAVGKFAVGKFGRHQGVAVGGYISIGCERHTFDHWLKNFEKIGESNDYSEQEMAMYGQWIKMAVEG